MKNTCKKGCHRSRFIAKQQQRTISASNDHFAEGDWDKFQTNILLPAQSYQDGYKKGIRTTKGAIIASFKATGQNHRHLKFEVAIVCALGDVQCQTRELP